MKILSLLYPVNPVVLTYRAMWIRVLEIARQLRLNGAEVKVVAYLPSWIRRKLDNKHMPLHEIYGVEYEFGVYPPLSTLREIKKEDYDIIYANNVFSGAIGTLNLRLLNLLKKRDKSIPLVADVHGIMTFEFPFIYDINSISSHVKFQIFRALEKGLFKFSDFFIVVSRKMKQYIAKYYNTSPEKMKYITNGVDLTEFNPNRFPKSIIHEYREKLGLEDKFIFGYIGAFQRWQGVENFIQAAKLITNSNVAFLIVGGDWENPHWMGNVLYLPKVPREKIPLYYALCDVCVLPRPSHPATEVAAPTKFAEYTAMGKPILSTEVGDAAELIKKYQNGIIVKTNAPQHLKEGIERFLQMSEKDLRRMGKYSRKLAETEFNWYELGQKLFSTINSLIE